MVPRDPEQKLFLLNRLANHLSGLLLPVLIVGQLVEGESVSADVLLVSAGAGRQTLPAIVVEHFLDGFGEQLDARGGAAAAEQIERKKNNSSYSLSFPRSAWERRLGRS